MRKRVFALLLITSVFALFTGYTPAASETLEIPEDFKAGNIQSSTEICFNFEPNGLMQMMEFAQEADFFTRNEGELSQ